MTETPVRHAVRFTLNDEAATAHVTANETFVGLLQDRFEAAQMAARTRAKRKES